MMMLMIVMSTMMKDDKMMKDYDEMVSHHFLNCISFDSIEREQASHDLPEDQSERIHIRCLWEAAFTKCNLCMERDSIRILIQIACYLRCHPVYEQLFYVNSLSATDFKLNRLQ